MDKGPTKVVGAGIALGRGQCRKGRHKVDIWALYAEKKSVKSIIIRDSDNMRIGFCKAEWPGRGRNDFLPKNILNNQQPL
ncbi:MAG: hypothetical protein EA411_12920 [Saprospirales bacterium]|nr:MAG: hypothetical protein EA411_12920 [Saprospirales bacterium]